MKLFFKKTIRILILLFVILNVIAFFHAYKLTHFSQSITERTKSPEKLSAFEKIKIVLTGVNNPKPKGTKLPTQKFETFTLKSNKEIECWSIKKESSKGTIILCHGYSGEKSMMLDKSDIFIENGYSTLLIDFMGSGNSEGNQTTIGYMEAEQVKTAYDYLKNKGEKNVYLFGTSMGAVAIMKCINDYKISPKGIIIECPFGSMYQTVCARFDRLKAPTFPMAGILLFWGGVQNSFWGFDHNPTEYAKNIACPTLLLYGENDKSVNKDEIDAIFKNITGKKKLNVYKNTGHENYLIKNKTEWTKNTTDFIFEN